MPGNEQTANGCEHAIVKDQAVERKGAQTYCRVGGDQKAVVERAWSYRKEDLCEADGRISRRWRADADQWLDA